MKIPRVFHRAWLGPDDMPADYVAFGRAWLDLHPGWVMLFWDYENLPPLVCAEAFWGVEKVNPGVPLPPAVAQAVQRADILGYELVHRFGGVYLNCDMQPLRNLEPLLADVDAFAGFEDGAYLCNAVIGATAQHPFFKEVLARLPHRLWVEKAGRPMNEQTGPHLLTEVWLERRDLTAFPRNVFYPVHFSETHRLADEHPESYALHHWGHTRHR